MRRIDHRGKTTKPTPPLHPMSVLNFYDLQHKLLGIEIHTLICALCVFGCRQRWISEIQCGSWTPQSETQAWVLHEIALTILIAFGSIVCRQTNTNFIAWCRNFPNRISVFLCVHNSRTTTSDNLYSVGTSWIASRFPIWFHIWLVLHWNRYQVVLLAKT